jgi:hypothetical protein
LGGFWFQIPDIEEVGKICKKSGKPCSGKCSNGHGHGNGHVDAIGKQRTEDGDWYMPENLDDLLVPVL